MNNFSDFVIEARRNYNSESLLSSEINQYLSKVNRIIPENVKRVIYLTQKYNLLDAASIEEIKNSNKSGLKSLAKKYNIPENSIEDLWNILKDLKNKIKLLPQYQSEQERQAIELGKLSMDDLTIDLDSPAGRSAATKMYMPMVYKIVSAYVGKSKLDRQELISAALKGFTDAMNDWRKDDKDDQKVCFKTYAGFRVKQQILNDINKYGHTLSGTNWYASKVYGAGLLDAVSIDGMMSGDDADPEKMSAFGIEDKDLSKNEEKSWETLYKLLEDNFKQRDVNIFYRYFGLNGYKREKSKDIAKSMGMSEGNIRNSVINKIIKFLKNDRKASEILQDLQDMYTESLMIDMCGYTKEEIYETLINDDMYILLEELTKWNYKTVFNQAMRDVFGMIPDQKDKKILVNILKGDFEYLDNNFKKNKNLIIIFLSNLYPTENMKKKTDVDLLNYMSDLQNYYKKYKQEI